MVNINDVQYVPRYKNCNVETKILTVRDLCVQSYIQVHYLFDIATQW